jgi:hypothetical protein
MMNEEQKPKRKRQANPDRIVLSKVAVDNLAKLESQVEKAFGGMIRLKNKELTNLLLEVRCSELTNAELKMIRERYFDEVKAATVALQKLKQAKERGEELKLSDVLAQIQTPFVKEKSRALKASKASSVGGGGPATPSAVPLNQGSHGAKDTPSGGQGRA